jgi:hypothetical protein
MLVRDFTQIEVTTVSPDAGFAVGRPAFGRDIRGLAAPLPG